MENDAPRQPRSRANGAQTRQRLLAAAVSLWSEYGLMGVTVTSVAERAGTTRRTVYHHFKDAAALATAAKAHLDEQVGKLARGEVDSFPDPYGLIAGLAADSLELVRSHVFDMLNRDAHDNPLVQDMIRYYRAQANAGLLKPEVNPEHAAVITLAMWLAATMAVSLGRTPAEKRAQASAFSASFVQVMEHGLMARPASPALL